ARTFVLAAVGIAVALSPGPGHASRAADGIPAGLADAIHTRFGAAPRLASGSFAPPLFGIRAALSRDGTTAFVSAPGVANEKGAVYVYHVDGAGSWASSAPPTAKLTSAAADPYAEFGLRVVVSADG